MELILAVLLGFFIGRLPVIINAVEALRLKRLTKIKVGDKFIDNEWGDTVVEITKISLSGKEVKYKFLEIDGRAIKHGSREYPLTTKSFREQLFYKLIE